MEGIVVMTSTHCITLANLTKLLIAVTFSVSMAGCNPSVDVVQNVPSPEKSAAPEADSQTQTVSATNNNESSPAVEANRLPEKNAVPDVVCEKFLSLIHAGNTAKAEQLLTSIAYANTSRAGLELEPLGGPDSTFNVGDVFYVTTKQKQAHVHCTIMEPGVQDTNVIWTMKKVRIGWRISGVILEDEEGKQDFLSFENPADVAQIKGPEPKTEKGVTVITTPTVIIQEEFEEPTIALASFEEAVKDPIVKDPIVKQAKEQNEDLEAVESTDEPDESGELEAAETEDESILEGDLSD
jgi:hypothetical protein